MSPASHSPLCCCPGAGPHKVGIWRTAAAQPSRGGEVEPAAAGAGGRCRRQVQAQRPPWQHATAGPPKARSRLGVGVPDVWPALPGLHRRVGLHWQPQRCLRPLFHLRQLLRTSRHLSTRRWVPAQGSCCPSFALAAALPWLDHPTWLHATPPCLPAAPCQHPLPCCVATLQPDAFLCSTHAPLLLSTPARLPLQALVCAALCS